MYVYLESEPQLWTVGYYDAKHKWIPESDHSSGDDAAERVAWLNGDGDAFPISRSELESLRFRLKEANELIEPLTRENDRLKAANVRMAEGVLSLTAQNAEAEKRIIELEQLAEERLQMIRQRNTQIGVLQNHVAALEDTVKDLKKRLIMGTVTEQR